MDISSGVVPAATIAAGVSFILNFPFVDSWFTKLVLGRKRLAIVVFCTAVGAWLFLNQNPFNTWATIPFDTWLDLVQNILAALISSQGNHLVVNRTLGWNSKG